MLWLWVILCRLSPYEEEKDGGGDKSQGLQLEEMPVTLAIMIEAELVEVSCSPWGGGDATGLGLQIQTKLQIFKQTEKTKIK